MNWTWNFLTVLKDKVEVGWVIRSVDFVGHRDLLYFFKVEGVNHCEITFDYLFAPVPYSAACAIEPNWLSLQKVNISHWTEIDEVLEGTVGKSHSLELEIKSLDIFVLSESNESIVQINIIDFLLGLLFLSYCLYPFCLLEKMVIKVTFEHQIISIELLKLLYQVLFFHDKFNHLPGNYLSNLLNHSFKAYLWILFCQCFINFLKQHVFWNRRYLICALKYLYALTDKQYFSCSLKLYQRVWYHKLFQSKHVPIRYLNVFSCLWLKFVLLWSLCQNFMDKKLSICVLNLPI